MGVLWGYCGVLKGITAYCREIFIVLNTLGKVNTGSLLNFFFINLTALIQLNFFLYSLTQTISRELIIANFPKTANLLNFHESDF